jgi:hypothetical protein
MARAGSKPHRFGELQAADGYSLLQAVDGAFLQIVGTRFGGGVQAAEIQAGGLSPRHVLRPAPGDNPSLLLLAYTLQDAAVDMGVALSRVPGLTLGSMILRPGEAPQVRVLAELFDVAESNAHADGEPLPGGVRLARDTGAGQPGVQIIRTREQAAAASAGGLARSRGQVPPLGRHRPRAGLGLGGGSHRPALIPTARTAIAGRLLGRLGALLATAGAIGPQLGSVTLGLDGA